MRTYLISAVAIVAALGGTSYAAIKVSSADVRDGSLTSRDLRNGTVRSADVRDRSLRAADFREGDLPAGARGPEGSAGAQGEPGPQGERGPAGPPGPSNALVARDSSETVPSSGEDTVLRLSLAPGAWVVNATLTLDANSGTVALAGCALFLDGVRIARHNGVTVDDNVPVAFTGAETASEGTEAVLLCSSTREIVAQDISMTAIRVGELGQGGPSV